MNYNHLGIESLFKIIQTLIFRENMSLPRSITIRGRSRKWNNKSFVV